MRCLQDQTLIRVSSLSLIFSCLESLCPLNKDIAQSSCCCRWKRDSFSPSTVVVCGFSKKAMIMQITSSMSLLRIRPQKIKTGEQLQSNDKGISVSQESYYSLNPCCLFLPNKRKSEFGGNFCKDNTKSLEESHSQTSTKIKSTSGNKKEKCIIAD
jgi:hypothetical protein